MRVVLHIGTHKTGTSALQAYCAKNRDVLLARGIYYPNLVNGSNSFNFLGARLAFGQHGEVRRFFDRAVRDARKAGASTLLLSGESLYAMTSLFYRLYQRPCTDYWEHERQCVAALKASLPSGTDCDICCYVRRQDLFLESLYNQCVKHSPGFGGDIGEFLGVMWEALQYGRQLQLWADVFGSRAIKVHNYEAAVSRLPEDFLARVLGIDDPSGFSQLGARVNERLPRDLLEYKRILNRIGLSRADGISATVHVMELSQAMGDDGRYHNYLGASQRAALMADLADDWGILTSIHPGLSSVSALADTQVEEQVFYGGLSAEAAIEIAYRHWLLCQQPKVWARARLRRIYEPLRVRSGLAARILAIAGKLFRRQG